MEYKLKNYQTLKTLKFQKMLQKSQMINFTWISEETSLTPKKSTKNAVVPKELHKWFETH